MDEGDTILYLKIMTNCSLERMGGDTVAQSRSLKDKRIFCFFTVRARQVVAIESLSNCLWVRGKIGARLGNKIYKNMIVCLKVMLLT